MLYSGSRPRGGVHECRMLPCIALLWCDSKAPPWASDKPARSALLVPHVPHSPCGLWPTTCTPSWQAGATPSVIADPIHFSTGPTTTTSYHSIHRQENCMSNTRIRYSSPRDDRVWFQLSLLTLILAESRLSDGLAARYPAERALRMLVERVTIRVFGVRVQVAHCVSRRKVGDVGERAIHLCDHHGCSARHCECLCSAGSEAL